MIDQCKLARQAGGALITWVYSCGTDTCLLCIPKDFRRDHEGAEETHTPAGPKRPSQAAGTGKNKSRCARCTTNVRCRLH